ncbi:MAG: sigma-70 family RNA polymerase sigma factor, partial [Bacteroidetes bacterium]|nr:sigma-70 family RNA polymerase sigma factor [Bacteroidota bacterium]
EFDAEEIFQETCIVFFNKISTKNFTIPSNTKDDTAIKLVLGWLTKTANYKLKEHIRKLTDGDEKFKEYRNHVLSLVDIGKTLHRKVEISYDLSRLKSTLDTMKPIEKEIVLLSHEFNCFPTINKKNTKQFPKESRKKICEKYSINDVNFRKIKSQAFEKIIAYRLQ